MQGNMNVQLLTVNHELLNSRKSIINFVISSKCQSQLARGLRRKSTAARGFESHRGHGCLSVVSVVCCQVEVSATD